MSGHPRPSDEASSLSWRERQDKACSRFEAARRAGLQPLIEQQTFFTIKVMSPMTAAPLVLSLKAP
jgi:hypothetical protein